jgi:transposase-like protein
MNDDASNVRCPNCGRVMMVVAEGAQSSKKRFECTHCHVFYITEDNIPIAGGTAAD